MFTQSDFRRMGILGHHVICASHQTAFAHGIETAKSSEAFSSWYLDLEAQILACPDCQAATKYVHLASVLSRPAHDLIDTYELLAEPEGAELTFYVNKFLAAQESK